MASSMEIMENAIQEIRLSLHTVLNQTVERPEVLPNRAIPRRRRPSSLTDEGVEGRVSIFRHPR